MLEVFLMRALDFLLFWGVWLLAPLVIDLSTAIVYFSTLLLFRGREVKPGSELNYYPFVTVVVPVYNSAGTLYKCLKSLAEQSYPGNLIQAVCVNNGSRDNSFEVFKQFQADHPDFLLMWESLDRPGKSMALNVGLYSGQGDYLINLDSDT
ncbi:MAG: glycosyltransferase family A protein, partial [Syntrophomonadaceae bacterium]|nr:glycosyltransferase family A protein [Syntrophomonadaceae bacterium]